MNENLEDTIAAIATPPGEGGVAIIRLSGKEALAIANKIFSRSVQNFTTHKAHYGKVLDFKGSAIDEVLLLPMKAPRSYTGEDVVEIHCHGGRLITQKVLKRCLEAGARAAGPGEFTLRAFINGKMDLSQAEAVQSLISAQNENALHSAKAQLEGALSAKIQEFQVELSKIAAIFEAWIDYPEEGLAFASFEEIQLQLEKICERMNVFIESFSEGKLYKEGVSLCLIGAPNVGKSSLMNLLLGKERVIVTNIAGTTRDLIEEEFKIKDLHFHITDTAGIRLTDEIIEKEGIRRSLNKKDEADLTLFVLDSTRPLNSDERRLLQEANFEKTLVIFNKTDLSSHPSLLLEKLQALPISAKKEEGIISLKDAIYKKAITKKREGETVILTEERHFKALKEARDSLDKVIQGLIDEESPEFIVMDIRSCLFSLGQIVGRDVSEDILSAIFSNFCVGK
ncbi:MAG: tRNA uridine-5-carboxymethylaminomethyl(34) synthesis GTPase MnmE [Simkaniaceae bacterium]